MRTIFSKFFILAGDAKDAGILPRSLEVIFRSISGSEYQKCNLKPDLFCDVVSLDLNQELSENEFKQSILSMTLNSVSMQNFYEC